MLTEDKVYDALRFRWETGRVVQERLGYPHGAGASFYHYIARLEDEGLPEIERRPLEFGGEILKIPYVRKLPCGIGSPAPRFVGEVVAA